MYAMINFPANLKDPNIIYALISFPWELSSYDLYLQFPETYFHFQRYA